MRKIISMRQRPTLKLFAAPLRLSMQGLFAAMFGALPTTGFADTAKEPMEVNILHADINELLSIEVSSASRIPESLRNTPSAVFVITAEDIRRSGVRSVP